MAGIAVRPSADLSTQLFFRIVILSVGIAAPGRAERGHGKRRRRRVSMNPFPMQHLGHDAAKLSRGYSFGNAFFHQPGRRHRARDKIQRVRNSVQIGFTGRLLRDIAFAKFQQRRTGHGSFRPNRRQEQKRRAHHHRSDLHFIVSKRILPAGGKQTIWCPQKGGHKMAFTPGRAPARKRMFRGTRPSC